MDLKFCMRKTFKVNNNYTRDDLDMATMGKPPEGKLISIYGSIKKAWRRLHKNAASNIEQVLEAAPHKAAAVQPPTTHHENYLS